MNEPKSYMDVGVITTKEFEILQEPALHGLPVEPSEGAEEILAMSEDELDAEMDWLGIDFPAFSARLDRDIEAAK